jgi:hypothetical protein
MALVDNLEALIGLLADRGAQVSGSLIAGSGMNNVRAIVKLLDRGVCIDGNGHWLPLQGLSISATRIRSRCCWWSSLIRTNLRGPAERGQKKKCEPRIQREGSAPRSFGRGPRVPGRLCWHASAGSVPATPRPARVNPTPRG